MNTYLIIGKNGKTDIIKRQALYKKHQHSLVVYDGREIPLDYSSLEFENNAHIILEAHGTIEKDLT